MTLGTAKTLQNVLIHRMDNINISEGKLDEQLLLLKTFSFFAVPYFKSLFSLRCG